MTIFLLNVYHTYTPLEFLLKSARKYGDCVSLSVGSIRIYLFNHPNLIEEVLNKQNQNCIKDISYRVLKEVFGDGLLLSDGEIWKHHRQLMQPAFSSERIAGYASIIVANTAQMLTTWRAGEIRDIHREMSQLTIKAIAQTMFGVDVTETVLEIGETLDTIMLHYVRQAEMWFLLPIWLPTPGNWKAHRATKRLNEIVYGIIDRRRQAPMDDLLSRMMRLKDEDGNQLSDRELRDEVMTLLLAGHETTANALTWTLMLLAQNPSAEAKLVAEIRSVLEERLPTINDLPKLRYTEMVLKESMRLYPPAWILA
ncbi:MAG: cytochrome P450 [Xenococcaceae cyanobacterium MO_188.B32]|nr:cytochrome P450 [Xenococcaceae cyanobacterium MO_188.B32]